MLTGPVHFSDHQLLIVAILLSNSAYRPILKVLEERRQRIADGLANADKIKAELAGTEAARQEVLSKANAQANKLIEEARAAAARVQERRRRRPSPPPSRYRQGAAKPPPRTMPGCWRNCAGKSDVWWWIPTSKVTGKVLTTDDQKRLAEETSSNWPLDFEADENLQTSPSRRQGNFRKYA